MNPHTLTALRTSADELTRELDRMPADQTDWKFAETEWSQRQCLIHLALVERHIFLPRMTRIVNEDNPRLPVVDEAELFKAEETQPRSRADLLAAFLADRQAELALLEKADWSRPGTHAARGPITLAWVADYALGHTYEHLSQMMRVRLAYEVKK